MSLGWRFTMNFYSYVGRWPEYTRVELCHFPQQLCAQEIIKPIRIPVPVRQLAKSAVDFSSYISLGTMMSLSSLKRTHPRLHMASRENSSVVTRALMVFLVSCLYSGPSVTCLCVLCFGGIVLPGFSKHTAAVHYWRQWLPFRRNAWALVSNRPRFKAWHPHWRMKLPWASVLSSES